MKEKANKKLGEINKFHKDNQEKSNQSIKGNSSRLEDKNWR